MKTEKKQPNNFLDEVKAYFENTPREQIEADWEKAQEFDSIGPTVEEFLDLLNTTYNEIKKDEKV